MKILKIITILIMFIGCDNSKKHNLENNTDANEIGIQTSEPTPQDIERMKKNILQEGDINNFSVLYLYYDNNEDYTSILPFAVCMANKFKNKEAYWVIYENIIKIANNGDYKDEYFFELDSETQDYLFQYLIKGANLNQPICKKKLEKINELKKRKKTLRQ